MTNEAAERLRRWLGTLGPDASEVLDAALAAERKAGADEERERIRAALHETNRIKGLQYGDVTIMLRITKILDAPQAKLDPMNLPKPTANIFDTEEPEV